ncbi:hypothetical protein ACFQH6_18945 [Halobacteriaceae archaeon GCM10025711]
MVVTPVLISLLILLLVTKYYGGFIYRITAVVAFLGHVLVSLIIVPYVPYAWDINAFHRAAVTIASGGLPTASSTVTSFGTFQGLLYVFFPSEPTTVAVFNGLFAVLVFIPISYLIRQLYPDFTTTCNGCMSLVLFLPLPFLFLSIPMRDSLSVLLFFSFLALGFHSLSEKDAVFAMPLIPMWGILFLFRRELGLIALLGLVLQ